MECDFYQKLIKIDERRYSQRFREFCYAFEASKFYFYVMAKRVFPIKWNVPKYSQTKRETKVVVLKNIDKITEYLTYSPVHSDLITKRKIKRYRAQQKNEQGTRS